MCVHVWSAHTCMVECTLVRGGVHACIPLCCCMYVELECDWLLWGQYSVHYLVGGVMYLLFLLLDVSD